MCRCDPGTHVRRADAELLVEVASVDVSDRADLVDWTEIAVCVRLAGDPVEDSTCAARSTSLSWGSDEPLVSWHPWESGGGEARIGPEAAPARLAQSR